MSALYKYSSNDAVRSIGATKETGSTPSLVRTAAPLLLWFGIIVPVCCLVSAMYVLAEFIPKGFHASWLLPGVDLYPLLISVRGSLGILMWFLSSVVMPFLARRLAGSPETAVQMLIYGRLFLNQLTTFVLTFWLHEDCMVRWLYHFFDSCRDATAFDVSGVTNVSVDYSVKYTTNDGQTALINGTNSLEIPVGIISHAAVCDPASSSEHFGGNGQCSRALVAGMSKLLTTKLITTAFVAPCIYLVFCLPCTQRAVALTRRKLMACLPCFSCCLQCIPTGSSATIDTELVSVLMLLEIGIVMGLVSPVIPILCLCATLTHLGVFRVSRVHLDARLSHDAKPVSDYLVFAFVLGTAVSIGFFWDNRNGKLGSATFVLVSCGSLVLGYLATLGIGRLKVRPNKAGLREPLLSCDVSSSFINPPQLVQASSPQSDMEIESLFCRPAFGTAEKSDVALGHAGGTAEECGAALEHAGGTAEECGAALGHAGGTGEGCGAGLGGALGRCRLGGVSSSSNARLST